ncbi:hypothetical protein NBRC10513_004460 [Rhodotorula toruloides]|uniref:Uncharacterized protein n=1 Tax=Rhodotorula toruloides TaxID=5286 RepID=A0A2T0A7I3_RHOTO|nr:hypothetical protein AAT19DRAFT_15549 [Rhodotorula toruloides]
MRIQQPANTAPPAGAPAGQPAAGQGGDALDKGVNTLLGKSGHAQKPATVEKISDGIRSGFKKLTGKDVPVKDQEYA